MANFVFILGAGASAEGGCPVMNNFFDTAYRLDQQAQLDLWKKDLAVIDAVRDELRAMRHKVVTDVDNMEAVFGAIEMGNVIGRLGDLNKEAIKAAPASFVNLVSAVIQMTQQYGTSVANDDAPDLDDGSRHVLSAGITPRNRQAGYMSKEDYRKKVGPKGYDRLARYIRLLHSKGISSDIITFNYDLACEVSLTARGVNFDYYDSTTNRSALKVGLYKLHGSLNWYLAGDNEVEVDLTISELLSNARYQKEIPLPDTASNTEQKILLDLEAWRAANQHAGKPPLIVPPSEQKLGLRLKMKSIWSSAAEAISRADVIVIAGFSLPPTDQFFQHFFALSSRVKKDIRKIHVIDKNQQTINRISGLFGPTILDKQKYTGSILGFDEGIKTLHKSHEAAQFVF